MIRDTEMNVKMVQCSANMNNSATSKEMVAKPPKSVGNIMVSVVNTKTTMEASSSSGDGQLSSSTITTTSSSQQSASSRPNEPTHREGGDNAQELLDCGMNNNKEALLEDHRVEEDKDILAALMDSLQDEFDGNDFRDAPVNVVDVDADGAAAMSNEQSKKNKKNYNNGFANSNNFCKSAKLIDTRYVNAFCQ